LAAGRARSGARSLFAVAIVATPALAAYHLVGWLPLRGSDVLFALAGAWLGAWAADLVTGVVHWACDTWGDERTRFVGARLIQSFREHHDAPRAMLDHDWIEVNAEPAAAAFAAFVLLALPPVQEWLAGREFLAAFAWSLVVFGALANQIHQWSHDPAPARWVARAQSAGLILSPARHARHHRAPHDGDYCIAGGWLNPALDAAGFWRALERAVARLSGATPRRAAHSRPVAMVRSAPPPHSEAPRR
jgi:ubiquitin-conjugating enzyme E2 variant